jgi:hypothetical protein
MEMVKLVDASGAAARSRPTECACGNSLAHEGFYPCDADGHRVKKGASEGLQCCSRCGKITEAKTGRLAGHRSFALPSW